MTVEDAGFAGLLETPGIISPMDVLYFRGEVFRDGIVSQNEAETLFSLNSGVGEKCTEWNQYFVEAATLYLVDQAEPRGHVSVANAQWLIDCLKRDGRIEPANELELLVKILDRAQSSPEMLVGFALNVIARAVVDGEGPLADGNELGKGVICAAEVEMIRRVLYAFGGDRAISISRTEAEILFELNEKTAGADNDPAWRELFVKAIANYLMAVSTNRAPSRTEAIAREEWLEDTDADVGATLIGAFTGFGELLSKGFFEDLFDSAHQQTEKAWAERNARMQADMALAEPVTDIEAEWLIDKLNQDGIIDESEKALLAFIRGNSSAIAPALESIIDQNLASA